METAETSRVVSTRKALEDVCDIESWRKAFSCTDSEDQYLMQPSMGSIPKDIEGTLFRNGPSKFRIGEDQITHPFDGDGMVAAVSFSQEGAYFRNRFVKTKGYVRELQAGKRLYRGFSNLKGGILANAFRPMNKNLANTNVIMWAGNLLALWEAGLPYRLDPKNLETFGETTLGQTIDENRRVFTAHPKIDPERQRLVGFANINAAQTLIYEYDAEFRLREFRVLDDVKGFMHDFGVTRNYYLFHSAPLEIAALPWLLGIKNIVGSMEWKGGERGAVMHIVPRDSSKAPQAIKIPAGNVGHWGNAYEDEETGEVVADMLLSDKLGMEGKLPEDIPGWETYDWETDFLQRVVRYRFDLSSGEAKLVESATLFEGSADFPAVNPKVVGREYRYLYATRGALEDGRQSPLQGVMKLDVMSRVADSWFAGPSAFCQEPMFIPRKDAPEDAPEDFGYISTFVTNGRDRTTELVILDAQSLSKGPICRLPCKGFLPFQFHGSFVAEAVYTPEQLEKSFALSGLFERKGWNEAKSEFSGLGLNALVD